MIEGRLSLFKRNDLNTKFAVQEKKCLDGITIENYTVINCVTGRTSKIDTIRNIREFQMWLDEHCEYMVEIDASEILDIVRSKKKKEAKFFEKHEMPSLGEEDIVEGFEFTSLSRSENMLILKVYDSEDRVNLQSIDTGKRYKSTKGRLLSDFVEGKLMSRELYNKLYNSNRSNYGWVIS